MSDLNVYKSMFWREFSFQHVKWQAAFPERIWEEKERKKISHSVNALLHIAIDANSPLECEAFSPSMGHSLMMLHREAPPGEEALPYKHGHTDQDIPTYIRNDCLGLVHVLPFQIWALGFLVAVL